MQIMTSLINHPRTNPTLLIHKPHKLSPPHAQLRRNFDALTAQILKLPTRKQCLKGLEESLHGHEDAGFLRLLVDGGGGNAGADLVRADGVEADVLFGEDVAVGADEPDDGAVMRWLDQRRGSSEGKGEKGACCFAAVYSGIVVWM